MEFVKIVLLLKFEKSHSDSKIGEISEKMIWKEAIRRNIPKSDWKIFIEEEIDKNPEKYSKREKSSRILKMK